MSIENIKNAIPRISAAYAELDAARQPRRALVKAAKEAVAAEQTAIAADLAELAKGGMGPYEIAGRNYVVRNAKGMGYKLFPWEPAAPKAPKSL